MNTASTPLPELPRAVPKTAQEWFPQELGQRRIPFGRYCHEAADRIEKAEAQLNLIREAVKDGTLADGPFRFAVGSIVHVFTEKELERARATAELIEAKIQS